MITRPPLSVVVCSLLLTLSISKSQPKRPNSSTQRTWAQNGGPPNAEEELYSKYPAPHHQHPSNKKPPAPHSSDCVRTCNSVEEKDLDRHAACGKHRRAGGAPGVDGRTVGAVCTDSLLKSFKAVCLPACSLGDATDYVWPKVPKCTGMGTPARLAACEAGFFAGVEQTVKALGVDVERKKEEEEEERVRGVREEEERRARVKVEEEHERAREKEMKRIEGERARLGTQGKHSARSGAEVSQSPSPVAESTAKTASEAHSRDLVRAHNEKLHAEGAGKAPRVETYIEFTYGGTPHTLPVPFGANLPDLVGNFCRAFGEENVGECQRDLLITFKTEHPELEGRSDL